MAAATHPSSHKQLIPISKSEQKENGIIYHYISTPVSSLKIVTSWKKIYLSSLLLQQQQKGLNYYYSEMFETVHFIYSHKYNSAS